MCVCVSVCERESFPFVLFYLCTCQIVSFLLTFPIWRERRKNHVLKSFLLLNMQYTYVYLCTSVIIKGGLLPSPRAEFSPFCPAKKGKMNDDHKKKKFQLCGGAHKMRDSISIFVYFRFPSTTLHLAVFWHNTEWLYTRFGILQSWAHATSVATI